MNRDELPVAVIGGGPVGLAAAAHLIDRQIPVKLLRSRGDGRRQRARLGPCPHVFALALQYRCRVAKTTRSLAMARTRSRQDADRRGDLRGVSATLGGDSRDDCDRRDRGTGRHGHTPRHGQGNEPRPRQAAVRSFRCHAARHTARSGARRHRCIRHMDQPQSTRRQRIAGGRRAGARGWDRLRHSGCARP